MMTKRNIMIGGAIVVLAAIAIGLFFFQMNGMEQVMRRTIINNQEQAAETAAALQRTDRITTV